MKHRKFNAKRTHAVTERVLRSRCGVSDAYLFSVRNCHARALELQASPDVGLAALGPGGEYSGWHMTVVQDSLMYAMEMTLKSAQMIDGYRGFNKDLGIPGFIENFECNGFTYVYVRPTHRLDQIYGAETSDTMRQALERVVPVGEILKAV